MSRSIFRIRTLLKWAAVLLLLCIISFVGWAAVRIHQTSQGVEAGSNMREIGQALFIYAHEHSGHYPSQLRDVFLSANLPPEYLVVPWGSATPATGKTPEEIALQLAAGGHCSYVYLGAGRTEKDVTPYTVLYFTADGLSPTGRIFCGMGDGHLEVVPVPDAIQCIVNTLKEAPPTELSVAKTTRPTSQPMSTNRAVISP